MKIKYGKICCFWNFLIFLIRNFYREYSHLIIILNNASEHISNSISVLLNFCQLRFVQKQIFYHFIDIFFRSTSFYLIPIFFIWLKQSKNHLSIQLKMKCVAQNSDNRILFIVSKLYKMNDAPWTWNQYFFF